MMKNRLSQKGFSLVELMIVVAIIGILAAVAIPNFQRFQRKARQSEAKNMLTAYYTAEKAAQAEYNAYLGNFAAIGFKPEGQLGFRLTGTENANVATINNGQPPSGYIAACSVTSAAAAGCNTSADGTLTYWTERAFDANQNLGVSAPTAAPGAATSTTFGAVASGWVGGTQFDQWSVDQGKVFLNPQSGLE